MVRGESHLVNYPPGNRGEPPVAGGGGLEGGGRRGGGRHHHQEEDPRHGQHPPEGEARQTDQAGDCHLSAKTNHY